jgi:hypothetical protein
MSSVPELNYEIRVLFSIADRWRSSPTTRRVIMGFGRGVLLWLLGVPIPIILLLALFWHH